MKRKKAPIYLVLTAAIALAGAAYAQDDAVSDEPMDPAELLEEQEAALEEETMTDEEVMADEEYTGDEMGEETSEPLDTVEELEALISLPPQARLGREADEDPNQPFNVFATPGSVDALLGDQPGFVYFPEGVDPMIIPWVREQIVIQEKMEDAQKAYNDAVKTGNRVQAARALDIVNELQQKYTEAANNKDVAKLKQDTERLIASIDARQANPQTGGIVTRPDDTPELPRWIVSNTRGVVLDRDNPADSYVLLGDYILQEGDHVDRFPAVVVKEILPQKVVYEFENVEHVVSVQSL